MPLDLPENQLDVDTGSSVELPFPAPAFWVLNGTAPAAMKAVSPVHYFGGWACSAENLQFPLDYWESNTMPFPIPGIESIDHESRGKIIPSFASRSLLVTIIGKRQYSIKKENGRTYRVAPFTKGASPGLQVLALLGYVNPDDKKIYPWAPIILKASGWQVNHVSDAITAWKNALSPILLKAKASPKAWPYFWMQVGTFGQERKQEPAGEKLITPVSCHIPSDLNETNVERRYVGREIADWMNELSSQAHEWLHNFENMQAAPVQAQAPEDEYYDAPPPVDDYGAPPEDDSIPF